MLFYLNRGFTVEQALVDIVRKYFHQLHLDSIYQNFHISITNDHPFAHLLIHQDSTNTADIFPAIVISTESDSKLPEMTNVPVQTEAVQIDVDDLKALCDVKRVKTYIDEHTGEEITVTKKDGSIVYENIPGYCTVASDEVMEILEKKAESQNLYGISYTTRKQDRISIEIWSDNNQLKNELFEQLRMLFSTSINSILKNNYRTFDAVMVDGTLNGQRSNNFNFDFDVPLYGSHLSFAVDYNVQQIVIDSDVVDISEIIEEAKSYVKT